jgi:putative ATPase
MADLFDSAPDSTADDARRPLADRLRPARLTEVVGQEKLLAADGPLGAMIGAGRLSSLILWGPPGVGKTTIARLLAAETDLHFVQISAIFTGVADLKKVFEEARLRRRAGRGTLLFVDEIHRFNKAQQDALLPGVESGVIILVGATTENPFFEVNSPLISRSTLFRLEPLTPDEVGVLVDRSLADAERGVPGSMSLTAEARELLTTRCGGDARLALNALEMAAFITADTGETGIPLTAIEEALQRRIVRYDKAGDQHYDVISAFIKSVRGSDPDAAAFWLETMLTAGEDPEFITRRLVILASEDVGMADPAALGVAVAAAHALQFVGLPEAAYALHHATLYLATAPKSNSVAGLIGAAREAVTETPGAAVPAHLRSTGYRGAEALGHGVGYRYPHDDAAGVVPQQYLPDDIVGRVLYRPRRLGAEAEVARRLEAIEEAMGKEGREAQGSGSEA